MAARGIPTSRVSPDYLHSNSTSHTWAFSAVAELIDNAYDPDVNASELWIDNRDINGKVCLTFTDNGNGMVVDKLHKMLSFGYCEKVAVGNHQPIGHYGNGFKSGSMRLGKDAIVFSRRMDVMSVGLLSQTYLKAIKAETVMVPIISWDLPSKTRKVTPESKNNLSAICSHSIFKDEKELLSELDSLEKFRTGTRIIIYNLTKNNNSGNLELDFLSDPLDIRNPESHLIDYSTINRTIHDKSPEYKVSLREYCSILYLKPRMKIILRGRKVKTKIISKSLSETERDVYKPTWLNNKPVVIKFGFTSSKNPEDYGVMLYHKNRLIRAYEKVGYQKQANELGVGIVGVAEVFFLTPTHNKQDFSRDEKYNAFMTNAGIKLNEYWNEKRGGPNVATGVMTKNKVVAPDWLWAQCDNCLQWRRLPAGFRQVDLPDKWFCHMNPDASFNRCEIPEEPEDEDEALMGPSYKKHFKKQQSELKLKIKFHEKQQIKEKEMQLSEKERQLQRKEMEINQRKKSESYNPIVEKLRKLEEKAAKQEKMIEALHNERTKQDAASRQMLDAAESLNLVNLRQSELLDKVARGADIKPQSLTSKSKKRKLSESTICIKTEDGSIVEVIPNPDHEERVVDLTCDSDDETGKDSPSASKKSKDNNSKPSTITNSKSSDQSETKLSEDKKPNLEKLKEQINKIRTFKEKGIQTEEREETAEEKNYKKRLLSFQKNVHELLRRIDPSKDWGGPENIEGIIVQMMKHIEPTGEIGDSE
ncbi:MORC family CW-type zinc finger protein 3-like isoform X3 [Ostrea edulis]|uniref:MORC family CW-type zinc finger protein 3-like isoform X3 n=1 Tax=Ostrea edulis TaxID=37623 RepID=UPI0024AFE116|nr:MORC family CW-type zinc finger protein 3-like isoform X3 [Ostrea edulis]